MNEMQKHCEVEGGLTKQIIPWLGRWFLIKSFDNYVECDIEEIRELLVDDNEPLE